MPNIGRNDPCHCGALREDGKPKKYKKCCLHKDEEAIKEIIERARNKISEPFEKGGFLTGRPFIGTIFNGQRARAVGNQVFLRPLDETFQLFVLRRLSEIIGKDWFDKERLKQDKGRHPVFLWFEELNVKMSSLAPLTAGEKIRPLEMDGNIKALLTLAFDFYSLAHCSANPLPKMLKRLKVVDQFQGARYEIAVAGLVARSGFDITWISDDTVKHCEFIAKHKITKETLAFEAKSHHREGVLGKVGDFSVEKTKVKIIDHIREALEQSEKDVPLVIFDDLNLPLTPNEALENKKWFKDINEQLEHMKFYDNYKDTNYGALFITNFSWHFHQVLPSDENEVVMYFHTGGKYSIKKETLDYLDLATRQYGSVPSRLDEFS